jgi:DNA-binding CsgD family transcriptional regulator
MALAESTNTRKGVKSSVSVRKRMIPKPINFPSPDERKRLRVAFGMSQQEIAIAISCHLRTFRKYEGAETIVINSRNRNILADYSALLTALAKEEKERG